MQMLTNDFKGGPGKWKLSRQSFPKGYSQTVDVRAYIHLASRALLWTREKSGPGERSGQRKTGFRVQTRSPGRRLSYNKIDHFNADGAIIIEAEHNIPRFDISMNDLLLVSCLQSRRDLVGNFEC